MFPPCPTSLHPLLLFHLITFSPCYCLIALLSPTRTHGFRTCLDNPRCAPHGPYPSHESLQTSRNQVAAHSREWITHMSSGTVIVCHTLTQHCYGLTDALLQSFAYMSTSLAQGNRREKQWRLSAQIPSFNKCIEIA